MSTYGYLTMLKTMNVEALKKVFDDEYEIPEFRDLHVSIEYPIEEANYPGIWVDYQDADKLRVAGVDHIEWTEGSSSKPFTRWKFAGYVSFTITALTSLERDRLYDELVKTLAFGRLGGNGGKFREHVESNDFIAANMDFDEIEPQGNAAAPGTPWGTDEIIYERTLNMEIIGEFVSDAETGELLRLSEIVVVPHLTLPGEDGVLALEPQGDGPTDWH